MYLPKALVEFTADMLQRVYEEFDYRLDVCRASNGERSH